MPGANRDQLENQRAKGKLLKYCNLVLENETEDKELVNNLKKVRDRLQTCHDIGGV